MSTFSHAEYENLLYSLTEQYTEVASSTPNIKHHRLPAPGISSTAPNLPTLVAACLALG